jgi:hypothetical protein
MENAVDRLQSLSGTRCDISTELGFIAPEFDDFLRRPNAFNALSFSMLYEILGHGSLRLESEDSLYDLINKGDDHNLFNWYPPDDAGISTSGSRVYESNMRKRILLAEITTNRTGCLQADEIIHIPLAGTLKLFTSHQLKSLGHSHDIRFPVTRIPLYINGSLDRREKCECKDGGTSK